MDHSFYASSGIIMKSIFKIQWLSPYQYIKIQIFKRFKKKSN